MSRFSTYVLLLSVLLLPIASEADGQSKPATTLYLFWGRGCPHCEREMEFLRTLRARYPSLQTRDYEVWYDRNNAAVLDRLAEKLPAPSLVSA